LCSPFTDAWGAWSSFLESEAFAGEGLIDPHQLDNQEDRLAALRNELQVLKTQRLKLNEELILMVKNVAIDRDIAGAS